MVKRRDRACRRSGCDKYDDLHFLKVVTSCLTQAHLIELDKAREVAEKANEAKTQFLAMVSHEVR